MTGRISRGRGRCWQGRAGEQLREGGNFEVALLLLLRVHLRRIEHLLGVAEIEDQAAEIGLLERHRAVEAARPSGMAGAGADLLDAQPYGVLVAIDPHLDDALAVAGDLALLPQLLARAAVEPGLAGRDG